MVRFGFEIRLFCGLPASNQIYTLPFAILQLNKSEKWPETEGN